MESPKSKNMSVLLDSKFREGNVTKDEALSISFFSINVRIWGRQLGACFALLMFSVSSTIFAEMSKLPDGTYPYDTFMIPTIVELMKFVASACFLLKFKFSGQSILMTHSLSGLVEYSIPGLFYFISNNCVFYLIKDLGPAHFQILKNLNQ